MGAESKMDIMGTESETNITGAEYITKENRKWLTPPNIITIVVAVISIIVTIIIANYFRDKKELTIYVFANEQIIQRLENTESIDGLKILYNNTELSTPSMVKISVENTGNIDILDSDFLSKLTITLDDVLIYDCYITSNLSADNVEEMNNKLSINKNEIVLESFSLLKNEGYVINLITDKTISKPDVNARIKGVSRINVRVYSIETSFFPGLISGLVASFIMMITQIIWIYYRNRKMEYTQTYKQVLIELLPIVIFIIILILIYFFLKNL